MAHPNACVFCQIIAGRVPARTVYQDADHLAFFPLKHINPSHLVLKPKRHTDYLFDLDSAAYQTLWATKRWTSFLASCADDEALCG